MTPLRRRLILAGVLIIAALLAFPLRETIYETIVVPIAYIAWYVGLLYRSLSQGIVWWVVVAIVLLMIAFSLVPETQFRGRERPKPRPAVGPVENLAISMRRADEGVYFRWLIANRLGKLAYQILLHRENGRPRSVFAPLRGQDWKPSPELQKYLETGLHGSFVDFPYAKRPVAAAPRTPLDQNVMESVEFLESHVEDGASPQGF
jgi:hypothetical protein